MRIEHNVYADGSVQSLGFSDKNNQQPFTVGVVLPGQRHDLGITPTTVTMELLYGDFRPNKHVVSADSGSFTIRGGSRILLEAMGDPAVYFCWQIDRLVGRAKLSGRNEMLRLFRDVVKNENFPWTDITFKDGYTLSYRVRGMIQNPTNKKWTLAFGGGTLDFDDIESASSPYQR